MREWLTVIIGLLLLAVVLDGLRRMRQARRNTLRMPRGMSGSASSKNADTYDSELPNGGARVVKTRELTAAQQRQEEIRQAREIKTEKSDRVPQQTALNLDEHVPTLMEVEQQEQLNEAATRNMAVAKKDKADTDVRHARIEPSLSDDELDEDHPDVVLGLVPSRAASSSREVVVEDVDDDHFYEPEAEAGSTTKEEFREPEEVLVINVMAASNQRLYGDILLDTVLDYGMRFGEMNIFHHHENDTGSGGVLYSMANMVVPGTFDLDTMRDFSTPGVSLFLALPNEADSSRAFEAMLATAQAIAANSRAELKDENRSVMTAQTIEHYRTRIKEFERKQLSKAPL